MSTESMTTTGAAVPQAAADGVTNPKGIGLFRMVTTVITLIVGAGVFSLSGDAAAGGASGWAILTAWGISAIGVFCLVMTFFALSRVKPDLKGGIYTYAATGFGDFLGFNSAWGYWISALLCTVSFSALLFGALSYFFPIFGNGTNLYAVIGASCIIWFYAFLVSRGISEVTLINAVITISKFVPLLIGIIAIIFIGAFKPDIFIANLTTGADPSLAFVDQVQTAMMVTIWVFIGIEGASVYSERARKRSDVGKATIVGFIGVLALLVMVNLLSYGLMTQAQLAGVADPALGSILAYHVGDWGAKLIAAGLAISVLGAFLSWTLLCAEILRLPAREFIMPRLLGKDNAKGSPTWALLLTGLCTQVVLIYASGNPNAYDTMIMLASSLILLPYLWSALYQVKLAATGESYETDSGSKSKDLAIGILASIYGLWLLYAAGLVYLLYTAIFYAVGTIFYMWARKEGKLKLLSPVELGLVVVILAAAVFALIGLGNGTLSV